MGQGKRKDISGEVIRLCPQCRRELEAVKEGWGICPMHGLIESKKKYIKLYKEVV